MRESAINRAQGLRQSKILASEAVQIEQINKAKGEKNCDASCSSESIFCCSQALPCCKAGQWYCLGMRQRLLTSFPGFLGQWPGNEARTPLTSFPGFLGQWPGNEARTPPGYKCQQ